MLSVADGGRLMAVAAAAAACDQHSARATSRASAQIGIAIPIGTRRNRATVALALMGDAFSGPK